MMTYSRIVVASLCLTLLAACSATPEKLKKIQELSGQGVAGINAKTTGNFNTAKAQTVAAASIGVPEVYVDQQLGTSVELIVQSEYFSANGRTCRRYSETVNGQSVPGISCQDGTRGWVDIPLSSFLR